MSQAPLESMTAFKFVYEYLTTAFGVKWLKWLLPRKDEFLLLLLCWDVLSSKSIPRRFSGKVLTFSFDKGFPVIIANKSFFFIFCIFCITQLFSRISIFQWNIHVSTLFPFHQNLILFISIFNCRHGYLRKCSDHAQLLYHGWKC